MVKRLGLSVMALAAMLVAFTPRQAKAEVRFGVSIGAPVYSYPVPVDPYAYSYDYPQYYSAPVYSYRAPVYVAPHRDNWRHEWRERDRREHDSRGRFDSRGNRNDRRDGRR